MAVRCCTKILLGMGCHMNDNSIVFGLGTSGLFLIRELSKTNTNIICVGRKDDIGLNSKYGTKHIAESKESIMEIVNTICKQSTEKPKGYICSDQYLTLLTEECPEVFNNIKFIGPNLETYKLINNKDAIIKYCKELNINTPRTFEFKDIDKVSKNEFPLIIKWKTKEINPLSNPVGKTKLISNKKEFNILKNEVTACKCRISFNQLFAQSYVRGDNSNQFSFGGYFLGGEEKAGVVVNQIRQYPQGISSFVKETNDKTIEENIRVLVNSFVKSLKYTGFLEIEFKVDNKSGKIYLLDINPRPWGWVSILGAKYKGFHTLFLEHEPKKSEKKGYDLSWTNPIRDVISIFRNPYNSKNKDDRFLHSYLSNNLVLDIFDKNDLKPTLSIIKIGVAKVLRRIR